MTNLNERMLPDPRIEPATVRLPGGRASDGAPGPAYKHVNPLEYSLVPTFESYAEANQGVFDTFSCQ